MHKHTYLYVKSNTDFSNSVRNFKNLSMSESNQVSYVCISNFVNVTRTVLFLINCKSKETCPTQKQMEHINKS